MNYFITLTKPIILPVNNSLARKLWKTSKIFSSSSFQTQRHFFNEITQFFCPIANLPMVNEDLVDMPPKEWEDFRKTIKKSDDPLFVTPEYNRSVSAVLKNTIDVGSKPYGKNSFDSKPGAVVSVSRSAVGAFGANHHLRQSQVFLNVFTMAQPEAYIGGVDKYYGAKGYLTNDSIKKFLKDFIIAFEKWVKVHAG